MMDQQLLKKIDRAIEAHRPDVARTTIDMVNIKSVRGEPQPGAPFGEGPKAVLDAAIKLGEAEGFTCTDYGVGVVSLAMKASQPDLGIWVHGDVVPEGSGWDFEPYNAVEHEGCIVGRGAADNKGQFAAFFHLLRIFKQLDIPLKYNPALYVGSNEETGMGDLAGLPDNEDAKGFLNVCTPPRISLVPDGGFPVGYGGKGGMNVKLRSKTPLHGWTFTAGDESTPGRAEAVLPSPISVSLPECIVDGCTASSETPPRHGAHPDPNGNMITKLSAALAASSLIPEDDRYVMEFLAVVSKDIYGHHLGTAFSAEPMTPLTVFAHRVTCDDGYVTLWLNVRYPAGITYEEIVDRIGSAADKCGFAVTESKSGTPAYLIDPASPLVTLLCNVANSVTGDDGKPYTMSGGTYAHRLPNAYVFGSSANQPPASFPAGRGGAHGIDEAVSLDRLQRAMKIYARALLAINEAEEW